MWSARGRLDFAAMRIDERLAADAQPSFSFEFFPPKTEEGERNLAAALDELSDMGPTFVSVTYGAGGSLEQRRRTIDIVASIKAEHGLEAMAHFTCVDATIEELRGTLDTMRDAGIENVLALRGDPPQGQERVDRDRGRAALLARADRDDPRGVRLRDRRRRASPRSTSTRSRPRATCATSRRRSTPARAS